jgi:hypothetical protein
LKAFDFILFDDNFYETTMSNSENGVKNTLQLSRNSTQQKFAPKKTTVFGLGLSKVGPI